MSTFFVEFKKVFQEQEQQQISRSKTASAKPRGHKKSLQMKRNYSAHFNLSARFTFKEIQYFDMIPMIISHLINRFCLNHRADSSPFLPL